MRPSSSSPKILHVATVSITLRSFLLDHARHLRAKGWRVDGMARGIEACERCCEAYDEVFEIAWSRNPLDLRGALKAGKRIRDIVETNGYDIVHVHTPIAAFVTRLALRRRPKRTALVYTAHGFHFFKGASPRKASVFKAMERLAAPYMDQLVVINEEDSKAARALRLAPENRIELMPGIGVDLAKYSSNLRTEEARAKLGAIIGAQPDEPLFLSVAELTPRKRVADVISALSKVAKARLIIVGTGAELPRLEELAASLGVKERVSFFGYRDDVPELMAGATALILVSAQEGLPRCVLEAIAIGLPVIGADARGTRDLLACGSGIKVPVGDTAAIAAAMERLANDKGFAESCGRAGREAAPTYRIEHVLALHDALYGRLLGERASTSGKR